MFVCMRTRCIRHVIPSPVFNASYQARWDSFKDAVEGTRETSFLFGQQERVKQYLQYAEPQAIEAELLKWTSL